MIKFEYKVIWGTDPFGGSKEKLLHDLNALGAEGWFMYARYADTIYFARPLKENDE